MAVVLLLLGLSGLRLGYVQVSYGVWSWSAPPVPPRLSFHGQRYVRWDGVSHTVAAGYVRLDDAPDGGAIFGPPDAFVSEIPTALQIRTADGTVVTYALPASH